jgi:hypothetical protein
MMKDKSTIKTLRLCSSAGFARMNPYPLKGNFERVSVCGVGGEVKK